MRLLLQLLWLRVLHFYVRRDISGKTQDRVEKLPSRAGLLVANAADFPRIPPPQSA